MYRAQCVNVRKSLSPLPSSLSPSCCRVVCVPSCVPLPPARMCVCDPAAGRSECCRTSPLHLLSSSRLVSSRLSSTSPQIRSDQIEAIERFRGQTELQKFTSSITLLSSTANAILYCDNIGKLVFYIRLHCQDLNFLAHREIQHSIEPRGFSRCLLVSRDSIWNLEDCMSW